MREGWIEAMSFTATRFPSVASSSDGLFSTFRLSIFVESSLHLPPFPGKNFGAEEYLYAPASEIRNKQDQ